MERRYRYVVLATALLSGLALAACGGGGGDGAAEEEPATLEPVEGTDDLNRITLTERAAERLGIATDVVRETQVERTLTVGGEVVAVSLNPGEATVRVPLTPGDLDQVALDQPAVVLPLDPDDEATGLVVHGVNDPEPGDLDEASGVLTYRVEAGDHGLLQGQRIRVELPLVGDGAERMTLPYAAVIYDIDGETWVYTNPEPLVFVRHSIVVDYIDGDLAILTDGPASDTAVVTAGAAELLGIEFGVGK